MAAPMTNAFGEPWNRVRDARGRLTPQSYAREFLRSGEPWTVALNLLRAELPEDVAKARWIELLSEPDSGWSVQTSPGVWVPYCVPGYDPLCGDVVSAGVLLPAPARPAGFANTMFRGTVIPDPMPLKPWRVPEGLTACQRWRGISAVADAGVRDGLLRAVVAGLVSRADEIMDDADIDDANERTKLVAALVLEMAQDTGYKGDPPGENWWHPVAYTLGHGGQCEMLSALAHAANVIAGVPSQIVWIDQDGAPLNHVSVQVWYDGTWQWADASVRAAIGENPYVWTARHGGDGTRADGLG